MTRPSPKARVAELKEIIQQAKKEAGEAHARVNAAEGERYQLEREMKRAERASPAMLEVLKQMADGIVLRENRYNRGNFYLQTDRGNPKVRGSVFYGLQSREVIEQRPEESRTYRISDHGREVLAKRGAKLNMEANIRD